MKLNNIKKYSSFVRLKRNEPLLQTPTSRSYLLREYYEKRKYTNCAGKVQGFLILTFWRRTFLFQILAHPVFKM